MCECGVAACKCAKVRDIQTGPNLFLVLNTRTRDLMTETRGLRMRSYNYVSTRCCPYLETADAMSSHLYPI